jgi:hypothetical protein
MLLSTTHGSGKVSAGCFLYETLMVNTAVIGVLGFDSWRGLGNFLFATASRPALGPTQPPIQWVPGILSLRVKRPGREAHYSHLVPKSKNEWSYTSTPQYAFMVWCSVKAQGQLYLYLSKRCINMKIVALKLKYFISRFQQNRAVFTKPTLKRILLNMTQLMRVQFQIKMHIPNTKVTIKYTS